MTFRIFSQTTHNLKNGNINALITTTTLKLLKKKKCKFTLKGFNWVDLAGT